MRVKSVVQAMMAGLVMCATAVMGPQAQAKPQIPQGSYLQTCRNANIYQNTDLLAMCPNNQGQLAVVKLSNYALCGGDIANVNGQLVCRGGGGGYRPGPPPGPPPGQYYGGQGQYYGQGGYQPPPPPPPQNRRNGPYPPGSYLQSCQNAKVVNGWLQASCADVRGNWHNSQIPLSQCRGDIGNSNGRLICG
ncbi:CVNH domain-containing protein [Azorhizobium sp. AG788]|uniref:CVNH domain-containing protein n=1 Tax=Azorhizobium sp. AG788 TaxID=2183897 RepID=UPI003139FB06